MSTHEMEAVDGFGVANGSDSDGETDDGRLRREVAGADGRLVFGVNKVWEKEHGPHQIFMSAIVDSLQDINTTGQTFTCRFAVKQQWMMSRGDETKLATEIANLKWAQGKDLPEDFKPEWVPPTLSFPRLVENKTSPKYGPINLRELDCMIVYEQVTTIHAVFGEKLELHSFPFDCQDLSIRMDWDCSDEECQIWPSQSEPNFVTVEASKMPISEWKVRTPVVEFLHRDVQIIGSDMKAKLQKQPSLNLGLKVERVWWAYVNQVFVVLGLISASTMAAFALEEDNLPNRLGHTTTMFLTAIAFQFVVSTMLPKLPYLTVLDKYVLGSNCFITAILIQVAVFGYAESHGLGELANSNATWANGTILCANASAWLVAHIFMILFIVLRTRPAELAKLDMPVSVQTAKSTVPNQVVNSGSFHATNMQDELETVYKSTADSASILPKGTVCSSVASVYRKPTVHPLAGIYRADFSHGIEIFAFSVIDDHEGLPERLIGRKITGDPNVPAGRLSQVTDGIPKARGSPVRGRCQIRADTMGKGAFYGWDDTEVSVDDVEEGRHQTITVKVGGGDTALDQVFTRVV